MRTAWIVTVFAACGGPASTPAPEVPPADLTPAEDVATDELLEDVRYLLREAVRDHEAGLTLDAERRWDAAWTTWSTRLEPGVRARDRRLALAVDHAIGRLGDVLRSGSGRASPAWTRLDEVLTEVAPLVEPPPPAPTNPPAPAP